MLVFVLFAGVLVDRVNKRICLCCFNMSIWQLLLLYFSYCDASDTTLAYICCGSVSGTIMAFESPTRMTFVMI